MRTFDISTKPYGDAKMYRHKTVQFEPGLTVLVACNGGGKTTLINTIYQKLKDKKIPVLRFNNLSDGGTSAKSKAVFEQDYAFLSAMMSASEGESIILNMSNIAKEAIRMIRTKGNSVLEKYNFFRFEDEEKENREEPKEYWVLLDAVDSGMSVDNVADLKKYLLDPILNTDANGADIYIVMAANEFELCCGEKCMDVQSGKYIKLNNYNAFRRAVLKSREYKDVQMQKYLDKLKKAEEKEGEKK